MKRAISFAILVTCFCGSIAVLNASTIGDTNNNDNVTLADAILVIQLVSGLTPHDLHLGANVNGDKK